MTSDFFNILAIKCLMCRSNYCILMRFMQANLPRITDVSVIIVTRDGGEMLQSCVDSVDRSLAGVRAEVILVDNGSSDGSAEEIVRRRPGVRCLRNASNEGFARAVNKGLAVAGGKYFLLLNNDTLVPRGSIDALTAFMESHPECGIAGPRLLNEDGSRQHSYDNYPTATLLLLNKSLLRMLFPRKYPSKIRAAEGPLEVESVIGAALMIRRDVVEKIGSLDEDYFFFLEETDWCLRARAAGWKVMHLPSCGVTHLQGRTKRRRAARAKVEYTRSLLHFIRKHGGWFPWMSLRLLYPLKVVVNWLVALLGSCLTLFLVERIRGKMVVSGYLLLWFLCFCPAGMGLDDRE